jgi:hypothetical protein
VAIYKIAFTEEERETILREVQAYSDDYAHPEPERAHLDTLIDKLKHAVASPHPQENLKLGMGPRDGRA